METGLVMVRVVPEATLNTPPLTSRRMPRAGASSAMVAVVVSVPRFSTSWSATKAAGTAPRRAGESMTSAPGEPLPTKVRPVKAALEPTRVVGWPRWVNGPEPEREAARRVGPSMLLNTPPSEVAETEPARV